jgi:hypothetical protein
VSAQARKQSPATTCCAVVGGAGVATVVGLVLCNGFEL